MTIAYFIYDNIVFTKVIAAKKKYDRASTGESNDSIAVKDHSAELLLHLNKVEESHLRFPYFKSLV